MIVKGLRVQSLAEADATEVDATEISL